MRHIEFRGLAKNGRLVYGDFVCNAMHGCAILVVTEIPPSMSDPCGDTRFEYITVDPESVGQYIGKKDKKGKLIFDQDIVRIKYPKGGDFENTIGRVFFDEDEAQFYHGNTKGRPPKRMWEYAEVIGNMFENPDLVKRLYK